MGTSDFKDFQKIVQELLSLFFKKHINALMQVETFFTLNETNSGKQLYSFTDEATFYKKIFRVIRKYGLDNVFLIHYTGNKQIIEKITFDTLWLAKIAQELNQAYHSFRARDIGKVIFRNNKIKPLKVKLSGFEYINRKPQITFKNKLFFLLFKDITCCTTDNSINYTRRLLESFAENNYENSILLMEEFNGGHPAEKWREWTNCGIPGKPNLI